MIEAYQRFILNTKPSLVWVAIRFILHWVTLPVKLVLIGLNSLVMHLVYLPFLRKRKVPALVDENVRKERFLKLYENLPVFDNGTVQLYTNRVDFYSLPDGENHNMDHQCLRQGTYSFVLSKLEKSNEKVNIGLERHMWKHVLLRGYQQSGAYNANSVSGDMLLGLSLAMTNAYKAPVKPGEESGYDKLKDSYDELLFNIIDNDYALLEVARQDEDPVQSAVWDSQIRSGKSPESVRIKSARAMFQPGLETVGAQAITLLAALKIGDKLIGSSYAKKEYLKVFWGLGYGLLSLFPTTFWPSKRGYFNEHNCLMAAYVLSKLSTSKLERIYWNFVALYLWSLSYPYYNAYFTGLVNDLMPGIVSKSYMNKCLAYLYENEPRAYSGVGGVKSKPKSFPVPYNEQDRDEFHFDKDPEILTDYSQKVKSGLSFISGATMLELDKVKTWLK